jgi:protease-4
MTFDADLIVDRRRTRRKLFFWRLAAFVMAAVVLLTAGWLLQGNRLAGKASPHIARVTVSGLITTDRKFAAMLKDIGKSEAVKGVIVAVDSPGGTTAGGEEIYTALRKLAADKTVVAEMGTLAASAGYMVAIAADHIVAERTTITGSIGVLFQYGNVGSLLDKLGVEVKTIKSAPLKAEPSPFTYPEQPGAAEMIGRLIDDTYQWFIDIVAERRGLDRAVAVKLADGSVYSGRQALDLKLVDAIGGESEAVAWLESQRGVPADLPVIDWAPAQPFEPFGLGSLAGLGRLVGLDLSALPTQASLDGLVSVWHP